LYKKYDKMPEQIKRHIAFKTRVKDILDAKYVKGEGEWAPNYLDIAGKQVSRVNVLGVLVSNEVGQNYRGMILDDGSGRISIRSFEDVDPDIGVGNLALVIGRPREYGNERYVVPEILKKIDDMTWFELRKFQFKDKVETNIVPANVTEEIIEENNNPQDKNDPIVKVFEFIKKSDDGNGVEAQDIIDKIDNSEQIIKNLLETGEVFEIKPGRLKVLE